jgi:hypothetical protein
MRIRAVLSAGLLAAVVCSACGGSPSTPTPTPPPVVIVPTVLSITPSSGSTAGGTEVSITGINFAAGATVTIGGVAATNVRVLGTTGIQALTGAHADGSADVVVMVGGQGATLAKAFTFVVPVQNILPVITSLTIQSPRANAPANVADLNEDIAVSAAVTDAETPVSQLTFAWSADLGTLTGTGAAVRWRAPLTASTPRIVTITLRVTEVVGALDGLQSASAVTQGTTATATVHLHNSIKEVGDLSRQFLLDFSDSSLGPSYVLRDFWDGCSGKEAELGDVTANRANYLIRSFKIGDPTMVEVNFKGTCAYNAEKGDACSAVPCEWHDTFKATGVLGTTIGTDYLSAVYRNDRWWLCSSGFKGTQTHPLRPFIR